MRHLLLDSAAASNLFIVMSWDVKSEKEGALHSRVWRFGCSAVNDAMSSTSGQEGSRAIGMSFSVNLISALSVDVLRFIRPKTFDSRTVPLQPALVIE